MSSNKDLDRRSFIKAAGIAGGAALAGNLLGAAESEAAAQAPDPLLKDVVDLHIHCAPDDTKRKDNGIVYARQAQEAGIKAFILKTHLGSTYDQAYYIRQIIDYPVYAGVSLNLTTTGTDILNPKAVEKELQKVQGDLIKCVWLPTHSSTVQAPEKGYIPIRVVDDKLNPLPETIRVMELCGEHNIMLATGHINPIHGLALAKKAHEMKLPKFVITHATTAAYCYTKDQVKQALDLGAWVELVYISVRPPLTWKEQADYLRLDPKRVYMATDLGQPNNPYPASGFKLYIEAMMKEGVTAQQIDLACRKTPAYLLGI